MSDTAKLFMSGCSQAVRLPAHYCFDTDEVYIRRDPEKGDIILSSKPNAGVSSLPCWISIRCRQTSSLIVIKANCLTREALMELTIKATNEYQYRIRAKI